jgi:hypothetical protein
MMCADTGFNGDTYSLSDAGMARVLIEGRGTLESKGSRWLCYFTEKHRIYLERNPDPHKAVELAALAQIRGEG